MWIYFVISTLILVPLALFGWRQLDHRADRKAWQSLAELSSSGSVPFELEMLAGLPEPAQRYFRYTIAPGTPLHSVVEIEMEGEIGMGSKAEPNYTSMQATQILAPPHGLVWKLKTNMISGSDAALPEMSWTRFWLFNLVPIVRVSGADHHRSAFGRVVSEASFWAPATLLPSFNVSWSALDANTARAVVKHNQFIQAVDIEVTESGQPSRVIIQRWSDENPERIFREQPFGGDLSEFQEFGGYRLPTRVDGGNHIGTDDYFPFFRAKVTKIDFK